MTHAPLKSGEMAMAPVSIGGQRPYVRALDDGSLEHGIMVPLDHPLAAQADSFIRTGAEVRPGVRRVAEHIPYTAKGPARVSTDAYRSGWDGVFGCRARGGDGCPPQRAN